MVGNILKVVSGKDDEFAADIVIGLADGDRTLQSIIKERDKSDTYSEHITHSIHEYISKQLSHCQKREEKEVFHTLINACTFTCSKLDSCNGVRKLLGINKDTFYRNVEKKIGDNVEIITQYEYTQSKKAPTEATHKVTRGICYRFLLFR